MAIARTQWNRNSHSPMKSSTQIPHHFEKKTKSKEYASSKPAKTIFSKIDD
jgi:hypothetical protein